MAMAMAMPIASAVKMIHIKSLITTISLAWKITISTGEGVREGGEGV